MAEFKGTKGKWKLVFTEEVESHLDIAINSEKDDCVAWVYRSSEYKAINGQANALLISKAPEMLEMLEYCYNYASIYDDEMFFKLKELIKEATEF